MQVEEILSSLIRIDSENPPGREKEMADFLKQMFDAAGIENEVIAGEPGRHNFIGTLGEGPKSLLFLSHADTVPAGEGWDFPPFSGQIRDGMVLGRGAQDCKALVAAEAYAVLQLARGRRLNGKLVFAATADEEAGGKHGVKFLLEKHPEKIRADFCVTEGGNLPYTIGGKTVEFIQVGEKGTAWSRLTTRGVSCHGSLPDLGDNAISKMGHIVARIADHRPRMKLLPDVAQMVQELVKLKEADRDFVINENNIDDAIALFEDKAFAAYLKAITRMTISPNLIRGGTKTNIVPDLCQADLDIRVLPGQDKGAILRELRAIAGNETEIEIDYNPPSFSPTGSPFYAVVAAAVRESTGSAVCLPCISSGATDSRHLRPAGIPSYGIEVMAPGFDQELRRLPHARNERIDVASVKCKADFLVRLAQKYLG